MVQELKKQIKSYNPIRMVGPFYHFKHSKPQRNGVELLLLRKFWKSFLMDSGIIIIPLDNSFDSWTFSGRILFAISTAICQWFSREKKNVKILKINLVEILLVIAAWSLHIASSHPQPLNWTFWVRNSTHPYPDQHKLCHLSRHSQHPSSPHHRSAEKHDKLNNQSILPNLNDSKKDQGN